MQDLLRCLLMLIIPIEVLLLQPVNGKDLENTFKSVYKYVSDSCYKDTNNYIDNLKSGDIYCDIIYSGACWPQARAGFTVVRPCPYLFFHDTEFISRRCNDSGMWGPMNFSMCERLTEEETENVILGIARQMNMTGIKLKSEDLYKEQNQVFVTCSWISFVTSLLSLLVLVNIKDEENERFKLHKNLVFSYFMRISFFFMDHYAGLSKNTDLKGLCSTFWVFNRYFAVAEVTWMLNEAIVLLRRVTHAFDTRPQYKHLLMWGWGFPAFLTFLIYVPLMVGMRSSSGQRCWSYHGQSLEMLVLYAPMTAVLVINFGIMLFIIRILIRKMRDENFSEARVVWQATKGALVLMPLLGFIYLIIFYTSVDVSRFDIYASLFYPLQGTLVCLFYVIFNREVHKQLIHQWKKWSADKFLKNGRRNIQVQFADVQELEEPAASLSPPHGELNSFLEYDPRPASLPVDSVDRIKRTQELRSAVSVMSYNSYLTTVKGEAVHGGIYSKRGKPKNTMVCVSNRNCHSQDGVNHKVECFV